MKRAWIVLVLSWMAHGASPCSQSGVIFCNGFEGVKQEVSDAWGSASPGYFTAADPGPFNIAGNQVLKMDAYGPLAHVQKYFDQGYTRLYARWYQKWSPGYNWSKADHQGFTWASGNGVGAAANYPDGCKDTDWMLLESGGSGTGGGTFHWYVYHPGKNLDPDPNKWNPWGDVYNTGAPITSGRWYRVEVMIDLGTPTPGISGANGFMNVWLDGQQYGPQSGIWFRTCDSLKIRLLDIMTYARADWQQPGISIFYDDLVVSTQPIGTATRVEYARNELIIKTDTLPSAKKDSTYSAFLSATGGIKPYTWSIASGSLPPGLSINPILGNLKGTPASGGTFNFSVQIKDSGTGQTALKPYTLIVKGPSRIINAANSDKSAKISGQIRSGRLNLTLPAHGESGTVRVFDAMGHTVWQQEISGSTPSIRTPALPTGLYIGRLESAGTSASFRFAIIQ